MGILSRIFRRTVSFAPDPSDVKMRQRYAFEQLGVACDCFAPQYDQTALRELSLHSETQDTNCEAWRTLENLIETAASKRSREFAPALAMSPEMWTQIITLPASISKLTSVRKVYLYGSHLVRLPPEIGDMASLEELDVYTSYRLHWLPFEVTRCRKLKQSRFSTRALYGNYKYRPPFPRLGGPEPRKIAGSRTCSVCRKNVESDFVLQVWISLRIATDVLPLLVNACSDDCVNRLPPPATGYVTHPHAGGLELVQPPAAHVPPRP